MCPTPSLTNGADVGTGVAFLPVLAVGGVSLDYSTDISYSLFGAASMGAPQRKSPHPVLSSYPAGAFLQKIHFDLLELIPCSVYSGHWK